MEAKAIVTACAKKDAPDLFIYQCPRCKWESWPALDRETARGEMIEHYGDEHGGPVHIVSLNA